MGKGQMESRIVLFFWIHEPLHAQRNDGNEKQQRAHIWKPKHMREYSQAHQKQELILFQYFQHVAKLTKKMPQMAVGLKSLNPLWG